EVERILTALILNLINVLLHAAQVAGEPVAHRLELVVARFAESVGDLRLDAANLKDRLVRFADLVANLKRESLLGDEIGVGRFMPRISLERDWLRQRLAVDCQANLVPAGRRLRSIRRSTPQDHAGEGHRGCVRAVPRERLEARGARRRCLPTESAT